MEFVECGELFDLIVENKRLNETMACKYFQELISGINYIHQLGICHRDLKPENLLLDSKFVLKLADFGFAGPIDGRDKSGKLYTNLGTYNYMAPEIHLNQPYKGD